MKPVPQGEEAFDHEPQFRKRDLYDDIVLFPFEHLQPLLLPSLSYKGERFAQGREGAKKVFESNAELSAEVEAEIRKIASEKSDLLMTADDGDDEGVSNEE